MIKDSTIINVRNMTNQTVVYKIEEENIRKKFAGYETKKIAADELRKLYYIPGGQELLREYLCVENEELAKEFGVPADQVEYYWTQADVDDVLLNGSLEALEDALEFGPLGIIDVIQDRAVTLKINDLTKRDAIFRFTGANINNMIMNGEEDTETKSAEQANMPRGRRVSRNS